MDFIISNYEFELKNYSNKPYSAKEYKTINIDNSYNECHSVNTIDENDIQSDISISEISSSLSKISSSLSNSNSSNSNSSMSKNNGQSREKINYYSTSKPNKIRSCDYFSSKIVETNNDVSLEINDKNKSLYFNINYGDINISSYDLVKFINIFGAKLLQKNFKYEKIFKNFKNSDILKLYDKSYSVDILKKVQEILSKNIDKKDIDIFNYKEIKNDYDKLWKKKNMDLTPDKYPDYIDNYMAFLYNKYNNESEDSYIKHISPKKTEKLIILGDFHGSLSTFIRHLLRFKTIGVFDDKCKIKDDYKIIFLGDIVDRGIYSYEIVMILSLLFINNPEKIIINNGNHEEFTTNGRFVRDIYYSNSKNYLGNFINELLGKFRDINDVLEIYTEFNNVTKLQSVGISCLIPTEKNKYIFMCHGCLPHEHDKPNILNKEFKENIKQNKNFFIKNNIGTSIKWNDFYGKKETIASLRTFEENVEIKRVGKNVLNDAIENNIVMVIRGHEDLNHNSKIMKNNEFQWESLNSQKTDYEKCKINDNILSNMTHIIKIDDETKNIIIDDKKTDYLPIITISTNTDLGKNLTSDSYIILSFGDKNIKKNLQIGGYKYLYNKYNLKIKNI